jgi:glucan 1,3-beta-glucosidase
MVGEWSLATDNCAMWLNGFNDNLPAYPKVDCMRIPCAKPYMGDSQPGAPPPIDKGVMNDPHGTGESYVINGTCPIDLPFEDEDESMRKLIRAKLFAYQFAHGSFYWNFRTEIAYRWSFQEVTYGCI